MFVEWLKNKFKKEKIEMTPEMERISKLRLQTTCSPMRNVGHLGYAESQEEVEILLKFRKLTEKEWDCLGNCFDLTEDFMEKHKKKLSWTTLSIYQGKNMSENFMKKMKKYIKWNCLSSRKKFSLAFIKEMHNYIDWFHVVENSEYTMRERYTREEMNIIVELGKTLCPYYGDYRDFLKLR